MSAHLIRHVLIDTDADFDDYMAIAYLLKHSQVQVEGITVTGVGAAHLSHGVRNISDFLTVFNDPAIERIPVVAGFQRPMIYSNTFPFETRTAADQHYGVPFPRQNPHSTRDDAIAFLRETLAAAEYQFSLLLIGGGTTWGHLFQLAEADAELRNLLQARISKIVMMGGNKLPEAQGNIQPTLGSTPYYTNRVAEWNIFLDPLAARYVFESGINVQLVALNASNDIPITQQLIRDLMRINDPVAHFIVQILQSPSIAPGVGNYLYFWDPLAAIALADPHLVTFTNLSFRIEQELNEEDDTSGMLIVDASGSSIGIALQGARGFVVAAYIRTLSGARVEATDETVANKEEVAPHE